MLTRDVTGDTTPDVVVELAMGGDRDVFVYACRAGRYEPFELGGAVRAIADLNGDGMVDIVLAGSVLEWDGEKFSALPFGEPDEWTGEINKTDSFSLQGGGAVVGRDSEGNPQLVLTIGIEETLFWESIPKRERTETWVWNGYHFTRVRTEYAPPQYRIHAVYDGDDASRAGAYDKALASYQQAITDDSLLGWSEDQLSDLVYADFGYPATPTPDPRERPRLSAYAQYRILVVHAAQGDLAKAQAAYDALQSEFSADPAGRPYAELAAAFWDEYRRSQSLSAACDRAVDYSLTRANDVLIPLSSSFYGSNARDYLPEDLCPFGRAAPSATTPPPAATLKPAATAQPILLTPTLYPTLTPGPSPTLGPAVTRTPAPAAQCPTPGGPPPAITLSDTLDGYESQILAYLNTRGSAIGLRQALNRLAVTIEYGFVRHAGSFVLVRDVTGDGVPEVVMTLTAPQGTAGAIFVFACHAGR